MIGARRVLALLLLAACSISACGTVVSPTSPAAPRGIAYEFALGHCGIVSPIDFDGALWNLAEEPATDDVYRDLQGTITLVDDEHAQFRSDDGLILKLERTQGPQLVKDCI